MKRLLLILILTLSFQTWTKADDIKDFQIEGMSIGDSLLDYFSEKEIKNKKKLLSIGGKRFNDYNKIYKEQDNKMYDRVVLYFKSNDTKYIIRTISGRNYYTNNINKCYDLQIDISNQIENTLNNTKKDILKKSKNNNFPNGDSYKNEIIFNLKDKSFIRIACYDYSKKDTNSRDRLSVQIATHEYNSWLGSKNKK